MNKSKIEWCDYTWNPVTGCFHKCEYCYARKQAKRFEGFYSHPAGKNCVGMDYCPENCRWITFFENGSRAHKGQKRTPEEKKNISEKLKRYYSKNKNSNTKCVRCIETG